MYNQSQDMKVDKDELFLLARKLGITQEELAKRFSTKKKKIIQARISEAFKGYRPELLKRIDKYLKKEAAKHGILNA
jgi:predicted transcriptional regulator